MTYKRMDIFRFVKIGKLFLFWFCAFSDEVNKKPLQKIIHSGKGDTKIYDYIILRKLTSCWVRYLQRPRGRFFLVRLPNETLSSFWTW